MKIMHICLASAFTENTGYQDVLLAKYNALAGHNVIVVSDCHTYVDGIYTETEEEDRIIKYGIRLIRYKYDWIINSVITNKVRKVKKLYALLEKENPEVILFHGLSCWELKNVAKFAKKNPNVIFYTDVHGDYSNTARNLFSKFFLHRIFYKMIIAYSIKEIDKIFYITEDAKELAQQEYGLKNELLEYLPLGGELEPEEFKSIYRKQIREELGISDDVILLIHTGKLDKGKKTDKLLDGFAKVRSDKVILLIAGAISENNKILEERILQEPNVVWLGWKSLEELKHIFYACDMYIQPGNQSATMQNAICCGLPVMLYPFKSHLALCKDNVLWIENSEDIYNQISMIISSPVKLKKLKENSYKLAKEVLDYRVLAERITRKEENDGK